MISAWVSVDISTREAGRPITSFETCHEFETQAQAEECGVNLARAWIDQRLKRSRSLEGQTPVTEQRASVSEAEKRQQRPGTVRQLKPKDPVLVER